MCTAAHGREEDDSMTVTRGRTRTGHILASLVLISTPVLLLNCGKVPGASNLPGVPAGAACPADVADASAIMNASFGLEGELEGKVKAALAAGANLQKIAAGVEMEVATACTNLAKDLGVPDDQLAPAADGPGKKAEAACNAASKAIGDLRAKAGGSIKIETRPPECSASMNAMADCAAKCDATVKPGEAKVECEGGKLSGACSGSCQGECTVDAGAKCEGSCSATCSGQCKGEISGTCDGTCNGKCDGKDSKGKCAGVCEGTCTGKVNAACNGECKGDCSASCTMQAKGECSGTCTGECSVEFQEPRCTGEVKPPEMSAECKAHCDAEVSANLECRPAQVFVQAQGAADVQAGQTLKAALEKNLPALLKVSMGMQSTLEGVSGNVKTALEGVRASVQSGGTAAAQVAGCFAASLDAQAKAAVSIDVSIKASASASASATASAG
nr:MAG: hypothetical protein DIU78_00180 [Pseudomonadota bacterium]